MITGCLRVRNEASRIERVIASLLPVCDRIAVFDDHSTDGTPFLCAGMPRTTVYDSPFAGLNEARDKGYLLDKIRATSDWVLWIDGDELLTPESIPLLIDVSVTRLLNYQCVSFKILYLWNDEQTVRTDGVYGQFRRQSMFRPGSARFPEGSGPNFHCGNCPKSLWSKCYYPPVSLLHLGYLDAGERIRKYRWYRQYDPDIGTPRDTNDGYRHIVVGDLFPADAKFQHGGPLVLESLGGKLPICESTATHGSPDSPRG